MEYLRDIIFVELDFEYLSHLTPYVLVNNICKIIDFYSKLELATNINKYSYNFPIKSISEKEEKMKDLYFHLEKMKDDMYIIKSIKIKEKEYEFFLESCNKKNNYYKIEELSFVDLFKELQESGKIDNLNLVKSNKYNNYLHKENIVLEPTFLYKIENFEDFNKYFDENLINDKIIGILKYKFMKEEDYSFKSMIREINILEGMSISFKNYERKINIVNKINNILEFFSKMQVYVIKDREKYNEWKNYILKHIHINKQPYLIENKYTEFCRWFMTYIKYENRYYNLNEVYSDLIDFCNYSWIDDNYKIEIYKLRDLFKDLRNLLE